MTATSEVQPVEAKIPSALACPEGDIFSLPSKEDIVNAFNEIAAIPGQLQGKVQEMPFSKVTAETGGKNL